LDDSSDNVAHPLTRSLRWHSISQCPGGRDGPRTSTTRCGHNAAIIEKGTIMSALRRTPAAVTGLLTTLTAFALLTPTASAQVPPNRSTGTSALNTILRSINVTVGVDVNLCTTQSRLQQLPPVVRRQLMKDSGCSHHTFEVNTIPRSVNVTVGVDVNVCTTQSRLQQLPPVVRRQLMKDSGCS
jgi:hypothetical protein